MEALCASPGLYHCFRIPDTESVKISFTTCFQKRLQVLLVRHRISYPAASYRSAASSLEKASREKHKMVPGYTLPARFLAHNVKKVAELDKANLKLQVDGHEFISIKLPSTGVSGQPSEANNALSKVAGTTESEKTELKDDANATEGNENPAIAAPSAGPTEEPSYSMSLDEYLDIRDQAACAFLTDANGKIDVDQSSLLLQAESRGIVDYAQCLVEHLARDMRCDLLSFDLDDLEDLGLAFHDQDTRKNEERTAKKEIATEVDIQAAPEPEAVENSGIADDVLERTEDSTRPSTENDSALASREGQGGDLEESDELPDWLKDISLCFDTDSNDAVEATPPSSSTASTSDVLSGYPSDSPAKERKKTADRDEEYCMAKSYFGTTKAKGRKNTAGQRERNKIALDAVFNASSSSASNQDTGVPAEKSSPLIIFVRDAVRISELYQGDHLLTCMRNRLIRRRQCNIPTLIILLCIGKEDSSYPCEPSWEEVKKIYGATECLALPVKKMDKDQLKKREASYTSGLNVWRLKRALKARYPQLVNEELVGKDVVWDCKGLGKVGSFLSSEMLDKDALNALIRTIGARAWGKPAVPLEDVVAVLNRKESSRDSEGDEEDRRLDELSDHEEILKKYVIKPGQSSITYDDIIMDPATKATVRQLIAISKFKPAASSGFILEQLKISGVLLYGPPGTGKTHLCRAIANDSGHTLIALSAAELNSKLVGETEKLIQAMFSLARKLYPSIIFLDEADSLFYRRASDDKSWQRSTTNQYLHEMDGLASNNSDNKAPLVIVATNRPKDLDEAFLRRLPHRVYFKLPSREERKQMLNLFLPKEDLDADVSISKLAKRAKAFSGSDLKNLCRQAALAWATEEVQKEEELAQKHVKLAMRHFELAFERTGPSTSPELLEGLMNFSERFRT